MKLASTQRIERQTALLPKSWSGLGQSLTRATYAMQRMSGMIAEQQARLSLILSCVDDGLVVFKKDGTVVIDNPAGREMLSSICTCGTSSKRCLFHTALAEVAAGTPRLIRECGTRDNPIRSDFKIVATDSGEEQIAVRLERIPEKADAGDGLAAYRDGCPQPFENETGKKSDAMRSNTILQRVAEAANALKPIFAGKIMIEETSALSFAGVIDEHVVQMLAYLVHQIVRDMNASGIGSEIRLKAGVEGDEPVLWVTHDGPQTDAPLSGRSMGVNASRFKRHLPLFAELRAVQNGLTLKSSRIGTKQRIEIRKRSSLG